MANGVIAEATFTECCFYRVKSLFRSDRVIFISRSEDNQMLLPRPLNRHRQLFRLIFINRSAKSRQCMLR